MPMIYVSRSTAALLDAIVEKLEQGVHKPNRLVKADVISDALEHYARKVGVR